MKHREEKYLIGFQKEVGHPRKHSILRKKKVIFQKLEKNLKFKVKNLMVMGKRKDILKQKPLLV